MGAPKTRTMPAAWFVVPVAGLLLLLVLLGARDLITNTAEDGARWEVWQQDGPDAQRDRDLIGGGVGFALERSFVLEPNDLILGGGFTGALEPGRYMLEFAVGNGSVSQVTVAGATAACTEGGGNGTGSGAGALVAWRGAAGSCTFVVDVLQSVEPNVDHSLIWHHEWRHESAGAVTFRFTAAPA